MFYNFKRTQDGSSAYIDDLKFNDLIASRQQGAQEAEIKRAAYTNNIRIPSCRELYCAGQVNPDVSLCRFPKKDVLFNEITIHHLWLIIQTTQVCTI